MLNVKMAFRLLSLCICAFAFFFFVLSLRSRSRSVTRYRYEIDPHSHPHSTPKLPSRRLGPQNYDLFDFKHAFRTLLQGLCFYPSLSRSPLCFLYSTAVCVAVCQLALGLLIMYLSIYRYQSSDVSIFLVQQ